MSVEAQLLNLLKKFKEDMVQTISKLQQDVEQLIAPDSQQSSQSEPEIIPKKRKRSPPSKSQKTKDPQPTKKKKPNQKPPKKSSSQQQQEYDPSKKPLFENSQPLKTPNPDPIQNFIKTESESQQEDINQQESQTVKALFSGESDASSNQEMELEPQQVKQTPYESMPRNTETILAILKDLKSADQIGVIGILESFNKLISKNFNQSCLKLLKETKSMQILSQITKKHSSLVAQKVNKMKQDWKNMSQSTMTADNPWAQTGSKLATVIETGSFQQIKGVLNNIFREIPVRINKDISEGVKSCMKNVNEFLKTTKHKELKAICEKILKKYKLNLKSSQAPQKPAAKKNFDPMKLIR